MIKVSRNTADFVREVLKKPQFIKTTVASGKRRTYYCVEDPRVMYELRKHNMGAI